MAVLSSWSSLYTNNLLVSFCGCQVYHPPSYPGIDIMYFATVCVHLFT